MRDSRKKKQTGETMRMLFLVTQIGLCMVSAIAVGLLLGVAAGFRSVWSLIARYAKDPEPPKTEPADAKQAEADAEFLRWKNRKG